MKIAGSVALVTGSSRGIGRNFVKALIAKGAKKVYASARDPSKVADLVAAHAERSKRCNSTLPTTRRSRPQRRNAKT